MAELAKPASIHWVDGSDEENESLCNQMVASGTFTKLNETLWPNCYYARSDASDVARVEDRTFICSLSKENAGPTNNWVNPFEMRRVGKTDLWVTRLGFGTATLGDRHVQVDEAQA